MSDEPAGSLNRRARKRLRQQREAAEARERFRFAILAGDVLRGWTLPDLALRVADVEIIPSFSGSPDQMFAWLIFSTADEAELANRSLKALEPAARQTLVAAGFPPAASLTFRLGATSWSAIEAGGGRFAYFGDPPR
jgi:hypothetical protein